MISSLYGVLSFLGDVKEFDIRFGWMTRIGVVGLLAIFGLDASGLKDVAIAMLK
jgi:hypothetical protein